MPAGSHGHGACVRVGPACLGCCLGVLHPAPFRLRGARVQTSRGWGGLGTWRARGRVQGGVRGRRGGSWRQAVGAGGAWRGPHTRSTQCQMLADRTAGRAGSSQTAGGAVGTRGPLPAEACEQELATNWIESRADAFGITSRTAVAITGGGCHCLARSSGRSCPPDGSGTCDIRMPWPHV